MTARSSPLRVRPARHDQPLGDALGGRPSVPGETAVGSGQHPDRIGGQTQNSLDPAEHFDCYPISFVGIVQAEPGHVPATSARFQ